MAGRSDADLAKFISRVRYKDWVFLVEIRGEPDRGTVVVQPIFYAPDSRGGTDPVLQKGRKWFLSRHSCDTEIVQTLWAAVQRAELHEMQEQFLLDGAPIFNNHISVHSLKRISGEPDQRKMPE